MQLTAFLATLSLAIIPFASAQSCTPLFLPCTTGSGACCHGLKCSVGSPLGNCNIDPQVCGNLGDQCFGPTGVDGCCTSKGLVCSSLQSGSGKCIGATSPTGSCTGLFQPCSQGSGTSQCCHGLTCSAGSPLGNCNVNPNVCGNLGDACFGPTGVDNCCAAAGLKCSSLQSGTGRCVAA